MPRIALSLVCALLLHGHALAEGRADHVRGTGRPVSRTDQCSPELRHEITALGRVDTPHGSTGYHVDKPGCYVLASDLETTSPAFSAILITAPHVILDLAGHTIRDDKLVAWGIRVVGPQTVVIRNGTLHTGQLGLYATDNDVNRSSLELRNVFVGWGPWSNFVGLIASQIDDLRIIDSTVRGVDSAAAISGSGVIQNSTFRGWESALDAEGFNGGRILRNIFQGDYSLRVGAGNIVQDNSFEGRWAIELYGDRNTIRSNEIRAGEDGIRIYSSRNRIQQNVIGERMLTGVSVYSGQENLISENRITGPHCGLLFSETSSNLYRRNVVEDSDEGVCGDANRDGGGNAFPPPTCGNEIRGGDEVCDIHDYGGQTCQDFGFFGGRIFCDESCYAFDLSRCNDCGNGVLDQGEKCDTTDLAGETCVTMGFDSGTLLCDSRCGHDVSSCLTTCGDGLRRGFETCDGSDVGGATCRDFGFDGGSLGCNSTCDAYDGFWCHFTCGNGTRGGVEQCDGPDLGGQTCESLGSAGGVLGCTASCTFDLSGCTSPCGNNVREGEEVCDGTDLGGETCTSQGRPPGDLYCNATCDGFNYGGCVGF